jgi:hypothetical protein
MSSNEIAQQRQDILRALDLEIEEIQRSKERPGWTTWAIMGALATSIWLIFEIIEKKEFNWQTGLFVFFLVSVFLDQLLLINFYSKVSATRKKVGRFILSSEVSSARNILFAYIFRILFLLYLGFIFSNWLSALTLTLFYIGYGFFLVTLFVILVLSFAKVPIELNSTQTTRPKIFLLLLCAGVIFLIVGFSNSFYDYYSYINMTEFRFAGLLWIIIFLILKLNTDIPKPILFDTLIELRRDLLLEKIDISSASKQFDIALSGLEISDLLQDEIREILHTYDKISKEYKIAADNLALIQETLAKASKPLQKEDCNLIKPVLGTVESQVEKITALVTGEFERQATKYSERIKKLITFYPHLKDNFNAPMDKLSEITNSIKKDMVAFSKQLKEFRENYLECQN